MTKRQSIENLQLSSSTWEKLLELFPTSPLPFYQKDVNDFFKFQYISDSGSYHDLQYYIDLKNIGVGNFSVNKTWWNESLDTLCRLVYVPDNSDSEAPTYASRLKTANAQSSISLNNQFVLPWYNIDQKSYEEIRSSDLAEQTITNISNLQFTAAANSYLRLIMPKYTRRVEIEDLNRDFWVIGQAVTYACRWLFEDHEGNIPNLFKKILDELLQLWENIIYLWGGAAISSQIGKKIYDKVKVIYLPLPNSFFTERKFDNFEKSWNLAATEIRKRCDFLTRKYNDHNLVIVPFIRDNNYYKNYFSIYSINYILVYDRNKQEGARYNFINTGIKIDIDSNTALQDRIYFIHEDKAGQITYGRPYSLLNDYQEEETHSFYGLVDVKPTISAHYDTDKIVFDNFKLEIFDAAARTIESSGVDKKIGQITCNITNSGAAYNVETTTTWTINPYSTNQLTPQTKQADFKGYMGEMISVCGETKPPIIEKADFKIVKFGDFLPIEFDEELGEGLINHMTPVPKEVNQSADQYSIEYAYDQATYGIGAYAYRDDRVDSGDNGQWRPHYGMNTKLRFFDYYEKKSHSTILLTPNFLENYAQKYIAKLIDDGKLSNNIPLIIATKMGVGFWPGDNGVQWEHGLVTDLFLYNPEEGTSETSTEDKVLHMSRINLLDGFWTRDHNIFVGTEEGYPSGQWRRLGMKCDNIMVKKLNGVYTYTIKNGIMAWYDHAKEVYNGEYADYHTRPYCSIDIDDDNKLIYGTQHNIPSGTNMAMTHSFTDGSSVIDKTKKSCENCYTETSEWNGISFEGAIDADHFIFD